MVDVNISFERGDRIRVVYEEVKLHPGGKGQKTVKREEVGEIKSKPSHKFDWPEDDFDFDYEVVNGNAVKSVDINEGVVAQLMYDAGGDRDWEQWKLVEITRLD